MKQVMVPVMRRAGVMLGVICLGALACPTQQNGESTQAGHSPKVMVPAPDAYVPSPPNVEDRPSGPNQVGQQTKAQTPSRAAPTPTSSTVPPRVLPSWLLVGGPVKRGESRRLAQQAHQALGQDRYDEAARLFLEAVKADPTFDRAYGGPCVAHMRAQRYEKCVEAAQLCITRALDPNPLAACYYNLGKCLAYQGQDQAAIAAYASSLELRENKTVDRAFAATAKRLRLGHSEIPKIGRRERETLWQAAARAFLEPSCSGPIAASEPGVVTCGTQTVWGTTGSFTALDANEALLAVHDSTLPRSAGSGFGVLLQNQDGQWQELARSSFLAPGEGGVDFVHQLPRQQKTSIPVVRVSDCWQGCCRGQLAALRFEQVDSKGLRIVADRLMSTGVERPSGQGLARQSIITGTRQIQPGHRGQAALLVRSEERRPRAYTEVQYYYFETQGKTLVPVGRRPPNDPMGAPCQGGANE